MDERIKAEWTKRLRDGRPQTTGMLHNDRGQCCLGVLCEIAMEEGIVERKNTAVGPAVMYEYSVPGSFDAAAGVLPIAVKEWAGLATTSGNYTNSRGRHRALADDNDGGASFSEIASTIDEYF